MSRTNDVDIMVLERRRRRHRTLLVLLVVMMIVIAACGSTSTNDGGSDPLPSSAERAEPRADAPVAVLAAGLNSAGFDLLAAQPPDENLVFSPTSIGHALLMARAAADETTAAAIDAQFQLPVGMDAHEAWNTVDAAIAESVGTATDYQDQPTPTVTLADRIWPRSDVQPDQQWLDLLASHHGAQVEPFDAGDLDGATERINGWVSDQTNGLVPELLAPGFITPNTVLVLTDAVYFKADWVNTFGKYGTVETDFTKLDGTTEPVSLMVELELPGPRGTGDGYVGAEIGYRGGDYSMLIIVPDEGRFVEIRDRLGAGLLAEVDAGFTQGSYELWLPKWETDSQLDLLNWLAEGGAAPGAYPAISPGAFLDGAVHGAKISVDEYGTEAAAATALGFNESGPGEPEIEVHADRPFLYVIRHKPTGLVLFAGQLVDPADIS